MHITNRHLMGCLLWSALLSACAPPPGTAPQSSPALSLGEQVFQRCLTCQSDKNENRPTGPNLFGLLGRKAATREGYFYSEALRKANLTWDRATLDAYLANPQVFVPDSFMLRPISDANERKAVLDYLQTLR